MKINEVVLKEIYWGDEPFRNNVQTVVDPTDPTKTKQVPKYGRGAAALLGALHGLGIDVDPEDLPRTPKQARLDKLNKTLAKKGLPGAVRDPKTGKIIRPHPYAAAPTPKGGRGQAAPAKTGSAPTTGQAPTATPSGIIVPPPSRARPATSPSGTVAPPGTTPKTK